MNLKLASSQIKSLNSEQEFVSKTSARMCMLGPGC